MKCEVLRSTFEKVSMLLPDEALIKIKFRYHLGRKLNLSNPITYNEKLQWLKLYNRRPEYTNYVDKYAVRKYIAEMMGEEYLIPLLGVYNDVEEIDWGELPNQFVLKCTHGSGCNIICTDKKKLDIEASKKKLKKWMKRNWFWYGREWPYKNVKPRIICEKYMSNSKGEPPNDYKIFCFNGEPKLILVTFDRLTHLTHKYYDIDWNVKDIEITYPNNRKVNITRPKFLDEMLDVSRKLSKGFPHVRVDLYCDQNKIFFGELTFYHMSGMGKFRPEEFEIEMGNWLELPEPYKE